MGLTSRTYGTGNRTTSRREQSSEAKSPHPGGTHKDLNKASRRHWERYPYTLKITFQAQSRAVSVLGSSSDISLNGLFFRSVIPINGIQPGDEARFRLDHIGNDRECWFNCRVQRVTPQGLGLKMDQDLFAFGEAVSTTVYGELLPPLSKLMRRLVHYRG